MTEADNDLRRRSWREIAERDTESFDVDPDTWADDARGALHEAADLLPFTELGELTIRRYERDPVWAKQHFPIPLIIKIHAINRREGPAGGRGDR